MLGLDRMLDWEGDVQEMARMASIHARLKDLGDEPVAERVVRDYVARGIVSRPERRGREAMYGHRQLVEFLAARALVKDGWPLAKISELFATISLPEIAAYVPGPTGYEQQRSSALDVAERLQRQSMGIRSERTPPVMSRRIQKTSVQQDFMDHAAQTARIRSELRSSLEALGMDGDQLAAEQVTLIAVARWCQLLVETKRLPYISVAEAEAVGRLVTAALLDPALKKGSTR